MPAVEREQKGVPQLVVQRENDLYLQCVLSQLGPAALLDVAGLAFSQEVRAVIRVRPVNEPGVHPAGIVQITDGCVRTSLFAKVEKADYSGRQNLEQELHFLSNVTPRVSEENPALRSPIPIAYYPERHLLLMEFVPGESLKHHIFDIAAMRTATRDPAELLQQAGRWLGSFHRLTLKSANGNPLEWLLQEFDSTRTLEAFVVYSLRNVYDEMLAILRRHLDLNPIFQRRLCDVHGEFTPIHVMVTDGAIYVVDFGSSRVGYGYEDVGLFDCFYECLLPWRALIGSHRVKLQMQREMFLRAYFEQAPAQFSAADKAIMRWVRLISFARILHGGQSRYSGWGGWAYSRLALWSLRDRFIRLCHAELSGLRALQANTFNDDTYSERRLKPSSLCGLTGSSRSSAV
jgi:tRNA A-37 threonylcarbamoyl transferase component Bud32